MTAGFPLSDSAKILRTLYRMSHTRLADLHGLVPARELESVAGYAAVTTGLAPMVTAGIAPINERDTIVGGGGCLGYSRADPDQLRMDYLADTMITVAYATWSGLHSVIYLPVGEEMITARPEDHDRWRHLGDVVEHLVARLVDDFAPRHPPVLVRTDAVCVRTVLDQAVAAHTSEFRNLDLASLYSLRPSGKATSPGPARLAQYRSTMVTYLPDVLAQVTGLTGITHVVVAENLHQVKAVNAARALAAHIGAGRIDHLAHVPAPSLTGTTRMAVARRESALTLADPARTSIRRLRLAPYTVQSWWQAAWHVHRETAVRDLPRGPAGMISHYSGLAAGKGQP